MWREEIKACGDTGDAGDSVGGGAGVKRRARMREKNVVCGGGRVGALDGSEGGEPPRVCDLFGLLF